MEARVSRFYELTNNPWYSMMNWVLAELQMPPKHRFIHVEDGWGFYGIHRKQLSAKYQFNRMKSVHAKNRKIWWKKIEGAVEARPSH